MAEFLKLYFYSSSFMQQRIFSGDFMTFIQTAASRGNIITKVFNRRFPDVFGGGIEVQHWLKMC